MTVTVEAAIVAGTAPTTPLPTSPDALADRILTLGHADLTTALTAQIGWHAARHTLADAYTIAATRLRNS